MNVHVSHGIRTAYGICPSCDRKSHPASVIGLCPRCLRASYEDAAELIRTCDPLSVLAAERSAHAAKVGASRPRNGTPGWVYFFRDGDRCKIGWSQNPEVRAGQLGRGLMIATMPGYLADEKALHRRFDLLRLDGEWFAFTPALAEYVAQIATEAA